MMFQIVAPFVQRNLYRPETPTVATPGDDLSERGAASAIAAIDAALSRFPTIEFRAATTANETIGVDQTGRTIRLIAVPFESPAEVMFRGQVWRETFSRSAFDDLGSRLPRVNRGHDRGRTIGRVVAFDRNDHRGLIADLRIARTALGDETLALAAEDCLSASIGFTVGAEGEVLDHRARVRRVTRAVIDHISLVEDPAYQDATILAVS